MAVLENIFYKTKYLRIAIQKGRREMSCSAYHLLSRGSCPPVVKHTCTPAQTVNFSPCQTSMSTFQPTIPFLGKTVYALSSGHGKCGVAIIRITGPTSGKALMEIGSFSKLPKPRTTVLRKLVNPTTGVVLDKALVIWFPAPASFTGEDSCELHVHGGPAIVSIVFDTLASISGLVPAEPGDFTRRAFANGKLDLPEVEGLADLIHAETELQRQQALRQMDGDLSKMYSQWRSALMQSAAQVSAYIDFSEEELIEDGVMAEVRNGVELLQKQIKSHLDDHRHGERLRDGIHLAIIGEPNVGKSSIFNKLCQRPAAIVSPLAGTTRDVVENALNISGYPVVLCDTAGMHDTDNLVEKEGVKRARQKASDADIQLFVIDASKVISDPRQSDDCVPIDKYLSSLGVKCHLKRNRTTPLPIDGSTIENAGDIFIHQEQKKTENCYDSNLGELDKDCLSAAFDSETIVIFNKYDLIDRNKSLIKDMVVHNISKYSNACFLSCTTNHGMEEFLSLLSITVKKLGGNPSTGNPNLTQARHRTCLVKCNAALDSYLKYEDDDIVLAAELLRQAIYEMGNLTGKITSEAILDIVFRDFCIGK